jgi:hypothetical protein
MINAHLMRAVSAIAITAALAGCADMQAADNAIGTNGAAAAAQAARMAQMQRGGVFTSPAPYYGSEVRVAAGAVHGTPVPRQFEGAHGISVAFAGADIAQIAAVITKQTNIPVNVRTRYTLPDGKIVEIPIGSRLTLNDAGSLSHLLDLVAGRMDVGWSFDGSAISFDRMQTISYALPLPAQTSSFATSIGGVTGAQGASRTATLTTKSTQDPWGDLKAALAPITPSPAYAIIESGAGRVTIFGPPSVQHQARQVINDLTRFIRHVLASKSACTG